MTPHLQRIRHNPTGGTYGDCYRTAIACLLDVDPEEVPHANGADYAPGQQDAELRAWLAPQKLNLVSFAYAEPDLSTLLGSMALCCGPDCNFILSGESTRGVDHSLIANASGVVHDVHPDQGGLIGPCGDGLWWFTFIGRLT